MKIKNSVLIASMALFIGGCIIDPKGVEDDFGKSVRQMVNAQIYDPAAASQPDELPLLILDGNVAGTGVDGYRKAAEGKKETGNQIIFSVN